MASYTCTGCPRRCGVTVYEENGKLSTRGNTCETGHHFALRDHFNPFAPFNSRIKLNGKYKRYLNVATEQYFPKDKIDELNEALKGLSVSPPVKRGDIILENACGTGINVIADSSAH